MYHATLFTAVVVAVRTAADRAYCKGVGSATLQHGHTDCAALKSKVGTRLQMLLHIQSPSYSKWLLQKGSLKSTGHDPDMAL